MDMWRADDRGADGQGPVELDLNGCTADMLCCAWDVTSLMLDRSDPVTQLRLVRIRQAYADELERIDPRAFRRWLNCAAGLTRPGTYFSSRTEI
jgi:hypothetical protein